MNRLWTVPNILTAFRLIAALLIPAVFLIFPRDTAVITALILYTFAAVTDYLDGWLARKLGQMTPLGRMLDPIADKIMVILVLFTLASLQQWHTWYFIVPAAAILGREIVISGLREFLAGRVVLTVTWAAKWKTTAQLFALGFLICAMIDPEAKNTFSFTALENIGLGLLWVAAILSVKTGYVYIKTAMPHLLHNDDTH